MHGTGTDGGTLCSVGQHGQARARVAELTALRDDLIAQLHVLAEVIKT